MKFILSIIGTFLAGILVSIIFFHSPALRKAYNSLITHRIASIPNVPLPTIVEQEPDNSFSQAMHLKAGFEVNGTLVTANDIDYYTFYLDKPSFVRIELKNLPQNYTFVILDSKKNIIASSSRMGFTATVSLLKITKPGDYFIQLSSATIQKNSVPYTIALQFMSLETGGNQ